MRAADQTTAGVALKPCDHVMIAVTKSSDGTAPYKVCSCCGLREYPTPASGAAEAAARLKALAAGWTRDGAEKASAVMLVKTADVLDVLAALTSSPKAEGEDMRPVEATWSNGDTHAYVNMKAALSAEAMPWRKKIGLRIVSFRFLDFEAPQPLQGPKADEHSPECWGRTGYSEEVAHCVCKSPPQPLQGGEVTMEELVHPVAMVIDSAPGDWSADDLARELLALIFAAIISPARREGEG